MLSLGNNHSHEEETSGASTPNNTIIYCGIDLHARTMDVCILNANRDGVAQRFADPAVHKSVEVDLALIDFYDQ
jgi:hypothetical protein